MSTHKMPQAASPLTTAKYGTTESVPGEGVRTTPICHPSPGPSPKDESAENPLPVSEATNICGIEQRVQLDTPSLHPASLLFLFLGLPAFKEHHKHGMDTLNP